MERIDNAILIILRILERDFCIRQEVSLANIGTPLFLTPFKMDAVSLAYLLLTIQEEVGIVFLPESYDDYRLLSIEAISSTLKNNTISNQLIS